MNRGWEIKSLGDIAVIKGGKRVPKGYKLEVTPTAHPYISVADFTEDGTICTDKLKYISDDVYEQIKNYTISSKDVYISIAGTIGKTGSVPKSLNGANLTENACKLVLNNGIDREFLYYFTKTNSFIDQAGVHTRTSAQPKLALVRLKTITLPVPSLPEQKRIVAILDGVFAGIDDAIANTEKNLTNARELFESYLNAVFLKRSDEWVEHELGDFLTTLTDYHANGSYKVLKQNVRLLDDSGYAHMVRSTDFEHGFTNSFKYIDKSAYEFLSKSKIYGGEIIVSKIGNAGKVYLMPNLAMPCSLAMNLFLIRTDERKIRNDYLYFFLKTRWGKAQISERLNGTTTKTIRKDGIRSLKILTAPPLHQKDIVEGLKLRLNKTQRLEAIYQQKLTALNELKQSILQKAFTGELTADTARQAEKAKDAIAA